MKRFLAFLALVAVASTLVNPPSSIAQNGIKKRRPLPHEYGRVRIGAPSADRKFPDAQFDHWLHRAKFTCRVCHVDLGFAMKANGTGVRTEDIMSGFYCGACHNGKMEHEGRKVFAACAKASTDEDREQRCLRCHSQGDKGKKQYSFLEFVKDLPKERFGNGINWMEAEASGKIKPVDYVEGASFKRKAIEVPKDIDIEAKVQGMNEIIFSHKKHSFWSGCEGCHPEIFKGVKKGETKYSMLEIFEGKYCGQCHAFVAFPMIDCQRCHTKPVQ